MYISEFCEAFIPNLKNRANEKENDEIGEYASEFLKRYEDIPSINSSSIQPRDLMIAWIHILKAKRLL